MDLEADLEKGRQALMTAQAAVAELADRYRRDGDHRVAGVFDEAVRALESAASRLTNARNRSW
jgi:hypothetical protein